MPSSRLGACLFNVLAFALAVGLVYWTLTSWTLLPTWLVIASTLLACLLLLTLWGWFLGPQGGPPVTNRDHRILERRANYDTPGKRLLVSESFEAAALVTVRARAYRARGMPETPALLQSLSDLADRTRSVLDSARSRTAAQRAYAVEHSAERWTLLLSVLAQEGVIEDDFQLLLDELGHPIEDLIYSPTLRQRVVRVRTLDSWPSDKE